MYCVPLYTWNKKGLSQMPPHLLPEYVSMRDASNSQFRNQGMYDPVVAHHTRWAFDPNSTVHITAGIPVRCEEDISRCGRLTEESFQNLLELW